MQLSSQANQATPTPNGETAIWSTAGCNTLTNVDSISITGRRPVNTAGEPQAFMTRTYVEAMLRKEQEKASTSKSDLDLKQPYRAGIKAVNWFILNWNPNEIKPD